MAIRFRLNDGLEAYLSSEGNADGGSIALGGSIGQITLAMTAQQSAALLGNLPSWNWHWMDEEGLTGETRDSVNYDKEVKLIYDVELVAQDGTVTRVLEGNVIVDREVTT